MIDDTDFAKTIGDNARSYVIKTIVLIFG